MKRDRNLVQELKEIKHLLEVLIKIRACDLFGGIVTHDEVFEGEGIDKIRGFMYCWHNTAKELLQAAAFPAESVDIDMWEKIVLSPGKSNEAKDNSNNTGYGGNDAGEGSDLTPSDSGFHQKKGLGVLVDRFKTLLNAFVP